MRVFILLLLWSLLLVLCWPLAILVLILFPIVWLVALPFRLAGVVVEAVLALLRGILLLPARILGERPRCTVGRG